MWIRNTLIALVIIVAIAVMATWRVAPGMIEKELNQVIAHEPYVISEQAKKLHQSLIIGDWHSDTPLWERDMASRAHRGHVDVPRLQQGNVALQMFTTVTKSPRGQNYQQNSADAGDNITLLAVAQGWPIRTWNSLAERALYQAQKVRDLAEQHPDDVRLILNQQDLAQFLEARKQSPQLVGAMIGTEGSHALDGNLDNVQRLFDAGFRMMSLQHFFDNKLGGSLHGESGAGLTEFGRQAIDRMNQLGIMIDLSHSAPQVVKDVLAYTDQPLIVSHTGVHGHCPSARNISDSLMQQIAAKGGIIGIGYWDGAVCEISP
ncbi:MAG: membrane dipeptidase, partial [Pseudomonadota bacterium]|nr:membrane dipeptidase [Pseudomonadota bacterium]